MQTEIVNPERSTLDARPSTALHRATALVLAASFAVTGVVFLAAPAQVGALLRAAGIAGGEGMPVADVESGLFRALAVAYMYLVTLFAWLMFRRPAEPAWPMLLAHAKLASAVVSLVLFAGHAPYPIYLVNAVVDGLLGVLALALWRGAVSRRRQARRQGVPA